MDNSIKCTDYIKLGNAGVQRDVEDLLNVGYGKTYSVEGNILVQNGAKKVGGFIKVIHVILLVIFPIFTVIALIIRGAGRATLLKELTEARIQHNQETTALKQKLTQNWSITENLDEDRIDSFIHVTTSMDALRYVARHLTTVLQKEKVGKILFRLKTYIERNNPREISKKEFNTLATALENNEEDHVNRYSLSRSIALFEL